MYSVGKADDGGTVLKVGDSAIITLTMNEHSVIQMIRLLAATLETVDVNIVDKQ